MKILAAALAAFTLTLNCNKPEGPAPEDTKPKEFTASKFNGYFVESLAGAFETFQEKDALPMSINVDGLTYGRGQYLAVACLLLKNIQEDPEHWEDVEVDVPLRMSSNSTLANNTF